MKLRIWAVLTEALSSLKVHKFRVIMSTLMLSAICTAAVVPGYIAISRADHSRTEALENGAAILIVTADDGGLDADKCFRAQRNSGVLRSGTLFDVTTDQPAATPGNSYRVARVDPGMAQILDPNLSADSIVYIGAEVSAGMAVRLGSELHLRDQNLGEIEGVLAPSDRVQGKGRWIFVVDEQRSQAMECWIEVDPHSIQAVSGALPAMFAAEKSISLRYATDRILEDASVGDQSTEYLWITGGILSGLVLGLMNLTRRAEFSLYVLSGFRSATVSAIIIVESGIILISSALLTLSWVISSAYLLPNLSMAALSLAILDSSSSYCIGFFVVLICSLLSVPRDPARSVRGRD